MKEDYGWTRGTLQAIMLGLGLVGLVRLVLAIAKGTDLYEPLGVMLIGFAITILIYLGFSRSGS